METCLSQDQARAKAEFVRKILGAQGVRLEEQPPYSDQHKTLLTWVARNGDLTISLNLNQYHTPDENGFDAGVSIAMEDHEINGITGFLIQRGKWIFALTHDHDTVKGYKLFRVFREIAPEPWYDLSDQDIVPHLVKLAKVFLAGKAE